MLKVKQLVTQSGPIICNPMDCSPPGSSVLGILQARILEWVAIPFSRTEPRSSILQADSLPSEPPGKPKCMVALPSSPELRIKCSRSDIVKPDLEECPH